MVNNNKPRITAIVRFNHSAVAIVPKLGKLEFPSIEAIECFAETQGYQVNIKHAHPAGASIIHPQQDDREKSVPVLRSVSVGAR